ncbi:MAG: hypothetical protein AAGC93_20330 [Cyanobacteria bacterium P01_F01_bin.53]
MQDPNSFYTRSTFGNFHQWSARTNSHRVALGEPANEQLFDKSALCNGLE